jgi:ferric-dicitrate binding protein FerR (iron transport regulator)
MSDPDDEETQLARLGDLVRRSLPDEDVPLERHDLERAELLRQRASRERRSRWFVPAVLGAALLATSIGAYAVFGRSAEPLTWQAEAARVVDGAFISSGPGTPASVKFSEGTSLKLAPDTRIRINQLDPRGALVVVEDGQLTATLANVSGSRWRLQAGPFNVSLRGREFRLNWRSRSGELELSILRGDARVEGPHLANGLELASGQELVAHLRDGAISIRSASSPAASSR